jgi:ubiquitin-like protein ATG12
MVSRSPLLSRVASPCLRLAVELLSLGLGLDILLDGLEIERLRSLHPSPPSHLLTSTPVVIRFKSIGSAPVMKSNVFKVTAGNKFQAVIVFLRGQLGIKASDALVSSARCRIVLE